MDFGIAKVMEAERQLTQVGMSIGTTSYLSPEQLRGLPVDQRADIFSFGVLAYELMTGRRPFAGDSVSAIFYGIAHKDPQPVIELNPECPPILADTIARCLEKDRDARYADFGRVIPDLDAAASEIDAAAWSGSRMAAPAMETTPIDWGRADTAGDALPAGVALRPKPAPVEAAVKPAWYRSPRAWGLITATVAVALFGVLNVARWSQGATDGGDTEVVTPPPPPSPAPPPASNDPAVPPPASTDPAGTTAAVGTGEAVRPERSAERTATEPPIAPPVMGGSTGQSGAGTASAGDVPAPTTPSAPALDARRILVLMAGPETAVAAAEAALEAGLLERGYEVLDANAIAGAGAGAGANRLASIARGQGAASVVVASIEAQATPSVGNFFTGTASLTLKIYDATDGRLKATETLRVGSGGTPGKLGPTEEAAQTDAATTVGRMGGQAVARRVGAPGGLP
jgi:hypothetical protein